MYGPEYCKNWKGQRMWFFFNKCIYKSIYVKKSYRKENYKIVFHHEFKENALLFFPLITFNFFRTENIFHAKGRYSWFIFLILSSKNAILLEIKYYTGTEYDYQIIRIQLAKIFKASLPKRVIINKSH